METLTPYTYMATSCFPDNFLRRVVGHAQDVVLGAREDQAGLIGPLASVLAQDGHHLEIEEVGLEQQRDILLDQAKKEHERIHKNASPRPAFEPPPNLCDCLYGCDESTKFLYAYHLVFQYSKAAIDKLVGVRSLDGHHCKSSLGGTVIATWGVTANGNLVLLAISWYADNESKKVWSKHLSYLHKHF